MNVTIFGATGMVGQELVLHCQAKGYHVRAFARNVEDLIDEDLRDDNFQAIRGSVFDEKDIYKALKGSDAVLSSLGGAADGVDKTRSLGMKHIVSQMKKAGVSRIVGIGGVGILNVDDDTLLMDSPEFPQQYVVVSHEHYKAYKILLLSDLDWTFVCPPAIVPGAANGKLQTKAGYATGGNEVSAGNLALFMVAELTNNQFPKEKVGIANA